MKALRWQAVAAQLVHVDDAYMPGLKEVLEVEPIDLSTWLTLLPIGVSVLLVDELAKLVGRRREPNGG